MVIPSSTEISQPLQPLYAIGTTGYLLSVRGLGQAVEILDVRQSVSRAFTRIVARKFGTPDTVEKLREIAEFVQSKAP
jgi:hypothetical protein